MDIIKFYFYIFLVIVILRVGMKWQDNNFMPDVPEIHILSPLTEYGVGQVGTNEIEISGVAGVKWAPVTNVLITITNGDKVWGDFAEGTEIWTNIITLKPGTNIVVPFVQARNGIQTNGNAVTIIYNPDFTENSFESPDFTFDPDNFKVNTGVNPNIVVYILMIIIDIFGLIGIFGFAYRKEIFTPLFWKIFFPIFTVFEAFLMYSIRLDNIWIMLFSLSMILPGPYSIYQYGFKYRWVEREHRLRENEGN